MKTKDLVYIGIITYLAYLLLKKKSKGQETDNTTNTDGTPNHALGTTVGNGTNGGLNLGSNMDLPNLTPTSPNGLSTEVALNSSNITPIIKENNPTQIYGNVSLPTPYYSTSVIDTNPVDVVTNAITNSNQNSSTNTTPTESTTVSETLTAVPIQNNGIRPTRDFSSAIDTGEIVEQPIASTISTPIKGSSIISEPIQNNGIRPIKNIPSEIYSQQIIEQPVA